MITVKITATIDQGHPEIRIEVQLDNVPVERAMANRIVGHIVGGAIIFLFRMGFTRLTGFLENGIHF